MNDADGELVPIDPVADIADPLLALLLPVAIEGLIAAGDVTGAAGLVVGFEARTRDSDHPWAHAAVARCRAHVLASQGDLDAAQELLQRSIEELRGSAVPFELARTLLVHGQVLRRRREKRSARDALDEALALFESLGAHRWAEQARTERSRLGVRRHDASLTVTEEKVARLVAAGMSNKQVAAAMFISVSTAKSNLRQAYAKLNVTCRAQLAQALAQRSLPGDAPAA